MSRGVTREGLAAVILGHDDIASICDDLLAIFVRPLEAENATLREERERLRRRVTELENTCNQIEADCMGYATAHAEAEALVIAHEGRVAALEGERDALKRELASRVCHDCIEHRERERRLVGALRDEALAALNQIAALKPSHAGNLDGRRKCREARDIAASVLPAIHRVLADTPPPGDAEARG